MAKTLEQNSLFTDHELDALSVKESLCVSESIKKIRQNGRIKKENLQVNG